MQALASRLACNNPPCVLDVRETWEQQLAEMENSINIPMAQVPDNLERLAKIREGCDLVVMCHHGSRSEVIVRFLQQNGFEQVFNLTGGINAWTEEVDNSLATY